MNLAPAVHARVWRVLSPRWAHAPLSGEGAARNGGRWNRPGRPTLYLSEQIETAFAEYQQELCTRPGTFVAYRLDGEDLVDLTRADTLSSLNVDASELLCPWKSLAWVNGETPPTWRLADTLAADYAGARTPSTRYPGGANVVLWRWNAFDAPTVSVLDPRGELPTIPVRQT